MKFPSVLIFFTYVFFINGFLFGFFDEHENIEADIKRNREQMAKKEHAKSVLLNMFKKGSRPH